MYMATSACTDGVARLALYSAICLSPLDVDQHADTPRALRCKGDGALGSSTHSPWDPGWRCLRQVNIARAEFVCQRRLAWSRSAATGKRQASSLTTWW